MLLFAIPRRQVGLRSESISLHDMIERFFQPEQHCERKHQCTERRDAVERQITPVGSASIAILREHRSGARCSSNRI
jgi:hypothetical protein